jgi:hypothetical protein
VGFLMSELGLSERRSCRIVGLSRSVQQYCPAPENDVAVVGRLKELASENRRYGYLRLHALLRREGLDTGGVLHAAGPSAWSSRSASTTRRWSSVSGRPLTPAVPMMAAPRKSGRPPPLAAKSEGGRRYLRLKSYPCRSASSRIARELRWNRHATARLRAAH